MRKIYYKLEDFYYDVKNGVPNLFRYFKAVWQMRSWDYIYTLRMLQFNLKELSQTIADGNVIQEHKDIKVKDIQRCIELIENMNEDNYTDRCGKLSERDDNDLFKTNEKGHWVDSRTEEEQKHDSKIYADAHKLENEEWDELWNIIKGIDDNRRGMLSWWD
jgi:hypothetical protein